MEIKKYLFEKWRDVAGYEGLYEVSNFGRVRSVDRYVSRGCKGIVLLKGKLLKQRANIDGHLTVTLYDGNHSSKKHFVHRLVAIAFVPNPENLPIINHKDENPKNNIWTNIEWCDTKYNCNYGTRNSRISDALSKPIDMLSDSGKFIRRFKSATEAGKYLNKFPPTSICKVANHVQGFYTAYGYRWEWA